MSWLPRLCLAMLALALPAPRKCRLALAASTMPCHTGFDAAYPSTVPCHAGFDVACPLTVLPRLLAWPGPRPEPRCGRACIDSRCRNDVGAPFFGCGLLVKGETKSGSTPKRAVEEKSWMQRRASQGCADVDGGARDGGRSPPWWPFSAAGALAAGLGRYPASRIPTACAEHVNHPFLQTDVTSGSLSCVSSCPR